MEQLFRALSATITEGKGSRIRVLLNGQIAGFHRPHPSRIAGQEMVRSAAEFLKKAGVKP